MRLAQQLEDQCLGAEKMCIHMNKIVNKKEGTVSLWLERLHMVLLTWFCDAAMGGGLEINLGSICSFFSLSLHVALSSRPGGTGHTWPITPIEGLCYCA